MSIVVISAQPKFLDLMYRSLLLCLLMSVCFFVAGYDAAARRRHKMPPNLATSGGKREELPQITRPQWMLDRVAECEASRPVNSFTDKLVLLVKASRGTAYRGPLTQWTPEEQILWELMDRALDAYTLKIDQVLVLDWPQVLSTQSRRYRRDGALHCFPSVPDGDFLIGTTAPPVSMRVDRDNIRALFGEFDDEAWRWVSEEWPFLYVPSDIVALIAAGTWRRLARRDHFSKGSAANKARQKNVYSSDATFSKLLGWPELDWHRQACGASQQEQISRLPFDASHAASLANCLRRVAPAILQAADPDQVSETQAGLNKVCNVVV